ncbi:MAG: homoserine kinase [Planctomycetes bacterium]|nr:homoserine kinase [Planctomycetota bacterium]
MKSVTAFAPASIGNLGVGFDVLGAAVVPLAGEPLGDRVTVEASAADRFECTGKYAERLPRDPKDNLVLKAKGFFEEALGKKLAPARVVLEKRLPLNSGLGSSASSSVAALVAFNAFAGEPLDRPALLALAARAEREASGAAHLDNAAPCLLGGLQLCTASGATRTLPFPDGLAFALAQPELELSTRESRGVLPKELPRALAVEWAQLVAGFVHALHTGERALFAECLRDVIAEPHRARLVKGFRDVQRAALGAGALACSLSGSGPAVFAVAEERDAASVAAAMERAFAAAGVASIARACALDRRGARLV